MSLVHKLGKDLANPEDFSAKGVHTGVTETRDDNLVRAIIVEGPLETLVQLAPEKGAVYSAAFPYMAGLNISMVILYAFWDVSQEAV